MSKLIEIKNRYTGKIILSGHYESIKDALEKNSSTNFRYSNFRGSDFSYFDFSGSNFRGSDFSYSDFSDSDFSYSDLSGSNFRYSDFSGSNFSYSDLSGSNFSDSNFSYSDFSDSNFSGSNFSGSNFRYSDFSGSDLRYSRYSIIGVFQLNYHELSDKLTLELMRHNAEFCGKEKMESWADGGDCPYAIMARDFIFNEKAKLWKSGKPKLRGLKLWKALAKEKEIKISL